MGDELERVFAHARSGLDAPMPSDALMARVLADAYAAQPIAVPVKVVPLPGWRRWLAAGASAVGGFRAVAGLGAAAVAGVVIGYANPPAADWLAQGLLMSDAAGIELLSADDLFLTGG